MRKIVFFLFMFQVFFLISCESSCHTTDDFHPMLTQVVLLDITAKNEMVTPVTIKIRHTYFWDSPSFEKEGLTLYSEWITEYLDGDESKPIGVEKTMIAGSGGEMEELEGFVLFHRKFNFKISSFELEIETIDNTFIIPGYTSTGIEPDDEDILKLIVHRSWGGESCLLNTYKQNLMINIPSFILPVTITIKADGSFSFEHEDVEEGNGIRVFTTE